MRHIASVLLLGTAVSALVCSRGPEPPPFRPVADTKLLMQSVVDPNADVIWEAVKTIDTPAGTQEIRPKSDEEWTAVRNSAVSVAEAGNLTGYNAKTRSLAGLGPVWDMDGAGNVSVKLAPVARLGPAFDTTIVYVVLVPGK